MLRLGGSPGPLKHRASVVCPVPPAGLCAGIVLATDLEPGDNRGESPGSVIEVSVLSHQSSFTPQRRL